jgi:hypothetical protein
MDNPDVNAEYGKLIEQPCSMLPWSFHCSSHLLENILKIHDKILDIPCFKELDPLLVSIDIESDPHTHKFVTEVGIAVLDTRNLPYNPNLSQLFSWMKTMKVSHYRIIDNGGHITEQKDKRGDPLWKADKFVFGQSKWVHLCEMSNIFSSELMVPDGHHAAPDCGSIQQKDQSQQPNRNIIIIGHSWKNEDEQIQKTLNFNLRTVPSIRAILDNQKMNPPYLVGLHRLCKDVGLPPDGIHNAGNDAAYQLAVCIARKGKTLYEANRIFDGPTTSLTSVHHAIRYLKDLAYSKRIHWVSDGRCTGCGKTNHKREDCWKFYHCKLCGCRGHKERHCRYMICRNCGIVGHLAHNCRALICKICRTVGHTARQCQTPVCGACGMLGHAEWRCPYVYLAPESSECGHYTVMMPQPGSLERANNPYYYPTENAALF